MFAASHVERIKSAVDIRCALFKIDIRLLILPLWYIFFCFQALLICWLTWFQCSAQVAWHMLGNYFSHRAQTIPWTLSNYLLKAVRNAAQTQAGWAGTEKGDGGRSGPSCLPTRPTSVSSDICTFALNQLRSVTLRDFLGFCSTIFQFFAHHSSPLTSRKFDLLRGHLVLKNCAQNIRFSVRKKKKVPHNMKNVAKANKKCHVPCSLNHLSYFLVDQV